MQEVIASVSLEAVKMVAETNNSVDVSKIN